MREYNLTVLTHFIYIGKSYVVFAEYIKDYTQESENFASSFQGSELLVDFAGNAII